VSFRDAEGIDHAVEVHADSMYEAAALGLRALKRSDWVDVIGPATRITIQVHQPPVEHFLIYAQLMRWLDGSGTTPAEVLKRKRLKDLLAGSA
jgi:hypothetical protein